MVEFRPFAPADLDLITPLMEDMPAMGDWRGMVTSCAAFGPAWTAWWGARPLACGGIATLWRGRGQAWCVIGADIPKTAWIGIHRGAMARLRIQHAGGMRRIEAEGHAAYAPALRWLGMLGFQPEGLAKSYGPNGEDFWRFARVAS